MDAFETLMGMLLRRQGYWTRTSFKVDLTREEKREIGRPSSPRWELDVVAFKGSTNEVLVVECKSYLDSPGVVFRGGGFEPLERYKLFADDGLRRVVLNRLALQLEASGAVSSNPKITLCLAAGNVATRTDREALQEHMDSNGWRLFDERWIRDHLCTAASSKYENDVAHVVAKLILRESDQRT